MDRRVKLSVASCIAVLVALALGGDALAQGSVPYSDPAGRYVIQYPSHWEQRRVGATTVALSPQEGPGDTFRENVNVVFENLPAPVVAAQYAAASMQAMQQQLVAFTVTEQGAAAIAGQPAYYLVYQHVMNGQVISVLAYFLVLGNRGYVITCSADPSQIARYRPQFQQIANTIRFF